MNFGVYPEVIAAGKRCLSKSQTVYPEQNNGRQRHWLARFRRTSIAVSEALEMADLAMALLPGSMFMDAGKIQHYYLVNILVFILRLFRIVLSV